MLTRYLWLLVALFLLATVAADAEEVLSTGTKVWFKAGSAPEQYEVVWNEEEDEGEPMAHLRSIDPDSARGFGTVMRNLAAEDFRGERVRLSGEVKAEQVDNWAGLWLRVDRRDGRRPHGFDNMHDRPIRGTTGWSHHEVIVDVAEDAESLAMGFLLNGAGRLSVRNLQLEVVGQNFPVTGRGNGTGQPAEPMNLSFDGK